MCTHIKYFIFLLWILFICCAATDSFAWSGTVISVADGDTVTVLHGREKVKIRLYGIDAPEKKQAYGQKSKKAMNAMVRKRTVEVQPYDQDKYGRTVAVISVNGLNVNESMVKKGLAWVYRKYCRAVFCRNWLQYEQQAREDMLGLWKDPHAMPPWEWRQQDRNVSSSTTAVVPGPYHGNIKSHVFHKASCKQFNCKNCIQGFQNREEAIAAGYRPCGFCNP